jgi:hypothetical protein
MLKAGTESSGSFSLERTFIYFIDAKIKNQEIGLQLATEIELHPEISIITGYWNIKHVNVNSMDP